MPLYMGASCLSFVHDGRIRLWSVSGRVEKAAVQSTAKVYAQSQAGAFGVVFGWRELDEPCIVDFRKGQLTIIE